MKSAFFKNFISLILTVMVFNLTITLNAQSTVFHGRLKVSSVNPHYLQCEDGTPFFWMGDTGWEVFLRLSREDAKWYIDQRKIQGFNIIQAVLISEFEGVKIPNYYNDLPFIDENPEKIAGTPGNDPSNADEYDYWDHIEYLVNYAEKQGMYLALLPAWGEYVIPREGRLLFKTRKQAYDYGWFLGNRFRTYKNIVWMLGGDRLPDERKDGLDMWRSMAEGIADGTNGTKNMNGEADYSTTCMTYHCFASSSQWFHTDAWLDFHSWGSYHSDVYLARSYEQAFADWNLPDPKPTLNSEPAYEMHSINWLEGNGYFMPYDIRDIAYWSVFAGACGHTYGNHCVWQFYDENRKPVSFANVHWKKALFSKGAEQMNYLRKLMESRPLFDLNPDNTMIEGLNPVGSGHIQAIRGKNFALCYIPTGNAPAVKLGIISGDKLNAWWYNPRTGESTFIGEYANKGERMFTTPGMSKEMEWLKTGRGCDWVLVLDDVAAHFNAPGK